jgi:hypothetical protein
MLLLCQIYPNLAGKVNLSMERAHFERMAKSLHNVNRFCPKGGDKTAQMAVEDIQLGLCKQICCWSSLDKINSPQNSVMELYTKFLSAQDKFGLIGKFWISKS